MLDKPLFLKNGAGKIMGLEYTFIVSPKMENGRRILFGGKVLELMDEASGTLANYYYSKKPKQVVVHTGEEVHFLKPLRAGETGKVIARVLLVTKKIICIYMEVRGGQPGKNTKLTRRYAGFGLCAAINKEGKMIKNLKPYRSRAGLTGQAERIVKFQRMIRKEILNAQ